VFVRTLTTDEGKTLARQHVSDYDAQSIYKSLSDFHSNSMHSELVGNKIMIFLTTFRYNVNHWAGKTAVSFIMYFLEQLRLYDEILLSSGAPVNSDTFKITVLDHAVQNVPDLRQTRILFNTLGLHFKTNGSFQSYFDLLHRAATVYDSTVFANPTTRPNRDTNRRVFATDIMASTSDPQDDGYYYEAEFDQGDS